MNIHAQVAVFVLGVGSMGDVLDRRKKRCFDCVDTVTGSSAYTLERRGLRLALMVLLVCLVCCGESVESKLHSDANAGMGGQVKTRSVVRAWESSVSDVQYSWRGGRCSVIELEAESGCLWDVEKTSRPDDAGVLVNSHSKVRASCDSSVSICDRLFRCVCVGSDGGTVRDAPSLMLRRSREAL
jgi:hypothetical protein